MVGDTLALFNPVATWLARRREDFGGRRTGFRRFGTGMEDYYDFSFAPRGPDADTVCRIKSG